jgi:transketolase
MLGATDEIISHRDLQAKFSAFGWQAQVVIDGHSPQAIATALNASRASTAEKPQAIIVNTRKGHRVPGLENAPLSHVTPIAPELMAQLLGGRA